MSVSSTRSRRQLAFWRRLGAVALSILPMDAAWAADACTVASRPQADFGAICPSSSLTCELQSLANAGIVEWAWDFGDESAPYFASTGSSFFRDFPAAGIYLVTLTVADGNGQLGTTTKSVAVRMDPGDIPDLAQPDQLTAISGQELLIAYQQLLDNDVVGVAFDHFDAPSSGQLQPSTFPATLKYIPPTLTVPAATDAFYYTVKDGSGHYGSALVTIAVTRPDPVAEDDFYSTGINVPLHFKSSHLLENDSPDAAYISSYPEVIYGTGGTAVHTGQSNVDGSRKYTFTPSNGFKGTASFPYSISWDGQPPYVTGTVYVEVVDRGPWADFTSTCVNRSCSIPNNNSGDDVGITNYTFDWGDGTSTSTGRNPTHLYTRPGRFVITQTVSDGPGGHTTNLKIQNPPPVIDGETHPAQQAYLEYPPGRTETRSISSVEVVANTPPVAVDDAFTLQRDIARVVNLVLNDTDPDDDPTTTTVNEDPLTAMVDQAWIFAHYPGMTIGLAPGGAPNELRIVPPDTFVGTITFPYEARDQFTADQGQVTLTVNQWDSITDALGEQFAVPQNSPWWQISKAALLANDYDQEGQTLTITNIDKSLLMGTLDCLTDPLICVYVPPTNAAGTTFFRYTATDPEGHFDTATVRLYVGYANASPTTVDDWFVTPNRTAKRFTIQDVTQNDIDPMGDTLTMLMSNGNRDYGAISNCTTPMYSCDYAASTWPGLNSTGFSGAGFVGQDRFMYQASDTFNLPVTGYINMLTLPLPYADRTFDAREDVVLAQPNVQVSISYTFLKSNDFDPEGQPITMTAASIDKTGLLGTMTCDATACLYKASAAFNGVTRFKYTATDSQGNKDIAYVKIKVGVANSAPVVGTQEQFSVVLTPPPAQPTKLIFSVFDLLKNDYDPDNDPLTVTVFPVSPLSSRNGHMDCPSPHYWCTFTPTVVGDDVVTYSVSDGTTTTMGTFKITITTPTPP